MDLAIYILFTVPTQTIINYIPFTSCKISSRTKHKLVFNKNTIKIRPYPFDKKCLRLNLIRHYLQLVNLPDKKSFL